MAIVHGLIFDPPLINSASPWASSLEDLQALYDSPHTGGVTTRTATMNGFKEDPSVHRVAFSATSTSSINSYGYSPYPLADYLKWVDFILSKPNATKPILMSITTSDPEELASMLKEIQRLRATLLKARENFPGIGVEINTSCPNIQGHPPPSYKPESLLPLLSVITQAVTEDHTLVVGLKLPPYVYSLQFQEVVDVLAQLPHIDYAPDKHRHPIAFLTCTNTLGSSLLFSSETTEDQQSNEFALPTTFGGLAGDSLHAISLGNVHAFSNLLGSHPDLTLREMVIIGVGGVTSSEAAARMRRAGASVVACATILGREGVAVFEKLKDGVISLQTGA